MVGINNWSFVRSAKKEKEKVHEELIMKYMLILFFILFQVNGFAGNNGVNGTNGVDVVGKLLGKQLSFYDITFSSLEDIKQAVRYGADVNAPDIRARISLHHAVDRKSGALEITRFFLKEGANPNFKNEFGDTALHDASYHSDPAVVEELLKYGADVNASGEQEATPLHIAEDPSVIKILLQYGADMNALSKGGNTPLHVKAEKKESSEALKVLLKHRANANARNDQGETPVDIAKKHGNVVAVNLLEEHSCRTSFKYHIRLKSHAVPVRFRN